MVITWSPPPNVKVTPGRISKIEGRFRFHSFEREDRQINGEKWTYPALAPDQRKQISKRLKKFRDDECVEYLHGLFDAWKGDSSRDEAQTYERLAKAALEIPGQVRFSGVDAEIPNQNHINAYQDLYEVTQCFIGVAYGPRKFVYRGVRDISAALLTAQVIDNPDSDRYYFNTSVISNHTGTKQLAYDYADAGIAIKFDTHREQIAMAIDHIYDTPCPEDELQLAGGVISVPPEGVIHQGSKTEDRRQLRTTISRLENPSEMTPDEHRDFFELLELMYNPEDDQIIGVRTDDGADRLQEWLAAITGSPAFTDKEFEYVREVVPILAQIDRDEGWNHH